MQLKKGLASGERWCRDTGVLRAAATTFVTHPDIILSTPRPCRLTPCRASSFPLPTLHIRDRATSANLLQIRYWAAPEPSCKFVTFRITGAMNPHAQPRRLVIASISGQAAGALSAVSYESRAARSPRAALRTGGTEAPGCPRLTRCHAGHSCPADVFERGERVSALGRFPLGANQAFRHRAEQRR
jgi:hypothetical protein